MFESSISGAEPDAPARLVSDVEKRAAPVFLSNAAAPRCNLLDTSNKRGAILNKGSHLRLCAEDVSSD